jgi:type II secretion system protein N
VRRFILVVIVGAGLIAGSWLIVFPEKTLLALLSTSLHGSGLTVDVEGFRKGFFYDFDAQNVSLKKAGCTLLSAENLACRLDLSSFLLFKPVIRCDGQTAGGRISGSFGLLPGKDAMKVSIDDARMEELPFLSSLGVGGSGNISGSMNLEKGAGDILFGLRDAHLLPASFGGIKVPLNVFTDGTGVLALDGRTLSITSFSLEGRGIYARVKGTIDGSAMDLKMELMPEKSFMEENQIMALLAAYRDSPGHYSIPIRTAVHF